MEDVTFENIKQQLANIQQYLDGTIAQINAMAQSIDNMGKTFQEGMVSLTENMRLIIEVIKKGRSNLGETIKELAKQINDKIHTLYEEKTLEAITEEEMKAVEKLKELNAVVSDNLYMQQLMAIIQSIREMLGRLQTIKMKKGLGES